MKPKTESTNKDAQSVRGRENKYLTFTLANEDYGIGILKIKEIIGMMKITPVPRTPAFIKGVINLRGKVIPVTDLRLRFGMPETSYTERTCIIVVEIESQTGLLLMGIVVDSVSEVLSIKSESIDAAPSLGAKVDASYILGMAKTEGGVKILLDIDRILNEDEIAELESSS